MARRLDLEADDPAPERAVHRNVTMIPAARRPRRRSARGTPELPNQTPKGGGMVFGPGEVAEWLKALAC